LISESEREIECPSGHTVYQISDLLTDEISCKTVQVFVSSGTHILSKDLDFADSVEEMDLYGVTHGPPSVIECHNNNGIRFSENSIANLANVAFLHCHRERNISADNSVKAALYFKCVQCSLNSVIVEGTEGCGLFADQCGKLIVANSTFSSNQVNIKIGFATNSIFVIKNSKIYGGNSDGGINAYISGGVSCNLTVINCDFQGNKNGHLQLRTNSTTFHSNLTVTALIEDSTFNMSDRFGIKIRCLDVSTKVDVILRRTIVTDNKSWGLHLENVVHTEISENSFTNNTGALNLYLRGGQTAVISECTFENHRIIHTVMVRTGTTNNSIVLEKSSFLGNNGRDEDCAVLYVKDLRNFTINNISIVDNNCTGIILHNSTIQLKNSVELVRNHGQLGGGMKLIKSDILFTLGSKLTIINNTAELYGGGIYSQAGTICRYCLYHFGGGNWSQNDLQLISLLGNRAEQGGDSVFGGCLSNCYVRINETHTRIDGCRDTNKFWNFVSSERTISQSAFVEDERHVEFCSNRTFHSAHCCKSMSISVYRGEKFSIPLMVSDDCCTPSVEMIEAKVTKGSEGVLPLQFEHDSVQRARKYCYNFTYTLIGGLDLKTTATIGFKIWRQSLLSIGAATLTVHLKDCPVEYTIDTASGKCKCNEILMLHKIKCKQYLVIPAQTWVGRLHAESESVAVQQDCQYCSSNEMKVTINTDMPPWQNWGYVWHLHYQLQLAARWV
jgi:predicted outer membrane repeat protein